MNAPDFEYVAKHGGVCPICCDFIAAGRSQIRSLVVPTPPNPAYCTFYAERGAWLVHGQYAKRLHSRTWAHARCTARLDSRLSADQQIAMAGDWRAELDSKRDAAAGLYKRQFGRQRAARATA
jgi:hypothetical protein